MSESTKAKKIDQSEDTGAMGKKKLILAGGIVLGALLVVYFGFSLFFMSHFFFGTSINGMNISGYSVHKVKEKTESRILDYELEIIDRDGKQRGYKVRTLICNSSGTIAWRGF